MESELCVQSQQLIMCEWCELVVPSSGLANHMRNSHPDAAALMPDRLSMMMMRIEDDDDQDGAFLGSGW